MAYTYTNRCTLTAREVLAIMTRTTKETACGLSAALLRGVIADVTMERLGADAIRDRLEATKERNSDSVSVFTTIAQIQRRMVYAEQDKAWRKAQVAQRKVDAIEIANAQAARRAEGSTWITAS